MQRLDREKSRAFELSEFDDWEVQQPRENIEFEFSEFENWEPTLNLLDLPAEILAKIFLDLNPTQLCMLCLVCKDLKNFLQDNLFWKDFFTNVPSLKATKHAIFFHSSTPRLKSLLPITPSSELQTSVRQFTMGDSIELVRKALDELNEHVQVANISFEKTCFIKDFYQQLNSTCKKKFKLFPIHESETDWQHINRVIAKFANVPVINDFLTYLQKKINKANAGGGSDYGYCALRISVILLLQNYREEAAILQQPESLNTLKIFIMKNSGRSIALQTIAQIMQDKRFATAQNLSELLKGAVVNLKLVFESHKHGEPNIQHFVEQVLYQMFKTAPKHRRH